MSQYQEGTKPVLVTHGNLKYQRNATLKRDGCLENALASWEPKRNEFVRLPPKDTQECPQCRHQDSRGGSDSLWCRSPQLIGQLHYNLTHHQSSLNAYLLQVHFSRDGLFLTQLLGLFYQFLPKYTSQKYSLPTWDKCI